MFRELVLCRKPSFRFFFSVSALVLIFCLFSSVSLSGMVFPCHVSLGYACLPLFHSLFLMFPTVLFSCCYLGPFIFVGFTFSSRPLFCIILFAVRVRSAPGAHTFCHFETAFRSLHMLRFGFGSRLFKVLIIHSPGPFWLWEHLLREECY